MASATPESAPPPLLCSFHQNCPTRVGLDAMTECEEVMVLRRGVAPVSTLVQVPRTTTTFRTARAATSRWRHLEVDWRVRPDILSESYSQNLNFSHEYRLSKECGSR